ncbi:hypothetical protein Tco_0206332 [Tanacetum coccineum]
MFGTPSQISTSSTAFPSCCVIIQEYLQKNEYTEELRTRWDSELKMNHLPEILLTLYCVIQPFHILFALTDISSRRKVAANLLEVASVMYYGGYASGYGLVWGWGVYPQANNNPKHSNSFQTYECGIVGEPVSEAHGEYVSVKSVSILCKTSEYEVSIYNHYTLADDIDFTSVGRTAHSVLLLSEQPSQRIE